MKPERVALIAVVIAAVVFVVSEELNSGEGCEMTPCNITSDPSTWPTGDNIWTICRAIAIAEGANVPGDTPDALNNPGDLSKGDEWGQEVNGYGGAQGNIIEFANKKAGWTALYDKVQNIVNGGSSVYCQNWTIAQIAAKWTVTCSGNWANNVASELGVGTTSTFEEIANG